MGKLSVILFTVFIFFLIPAAVGSAMDSPYLFNISINSTETLSFANHNESPTEGNWIKLSGGTPVTLPALNLVFNGVNSSNFTRNDKTINITARVDNYSDYLIEYPYSSHSIYTNVSGSDEVNLSFFGSSHFADLSIDVYLVSSTLDEVRDILNDAIDGNTTPIRNLLNDSEKQLNCSLNSTGDNSSISFGSQQAGDYVIFVLLNSSYTNTNEYSILSATAVQVLKYESVVTAPSNAKTNYFVPVQIELTAADQGNYTYGAILVHKNAYEATLRFEFNGTRNQTNLTIDGTYLVENGELTGINLSSLNTTKLQEIMETVIGPKNGTVSFINDLNSTSASFSLTTNDLNTGDYYLLVGAYESGQRLVAFNQSEVNIYTPTPSPPPNVGSGDGSSSSGGGGTSGELYENIACSETDRQYVNQNSDISYSFELECNIVQYVNFTGLTNDGQIATKVEILKDTSTLVDNPLLDIVYKHLNIWVGNAGWATTKNIADATVVFTVEKSWITENNIDEYSISLYRYSDDNWNKLVTGKIAEDANSLQFEAETPGFSPFAVTGKELEGEPGGEGIEPTVTVEKTPVQTPTEENGIPGFGIFAGLSVLLIAVQLLRKKK